MRKVIQINIRAFSLLELLIFSTLNLIVLSGLLQLYVFANKSYLRQIGRDQMLTVAQHIIQYLEYDLSNIDNPKQLIIQKNSCLIRDLCYLYVVEQEKIFRKKFMQPREVLNSVVPIKLFALNNKVPNRLELQLVLANPYDLTEKFKFNKIFKLYDQS